ncbi:MAG: threonine ammonia-lyase, partial [Planctomycetota bacterium]
MHARKVLKRYLPVSPLVEALVLSEELSTRVFLKLDCMLPTGAFKVRGGLNLLHKMNHEKRARGIVAATRGNHGQSLAYACRKFNSPCRLYVPHNNSVVKNHAMRALGAELIVHGQSFDQACLAAKEYADNFGARYIHPIEHSELLAGVGTWALEALEQMPVSPDVVFAPVGAGSCLFGGLSVLDSLAPNAKVLGVTPCAAPALKASLRMREITTATVTDTLADGLAVGRPHTLTYSMCVDSGVPLMAVSESEIRAAMADLLSKERIVAEGSAAATLAAARKHCHEYSPESVLLVITGRNVDSSALKACLAQPTTQRKHFVATSSD